MPCIIEYIGGTKGDFLVSQLSGMPASLIGFNKTQLKSEAQKLKHFLYESTVANSLNLNELENLIIQLKHFPYIGVHSLDILNDSAFDMLYHYDYQIFKICYDNDYYKSISIESFLKNIKHTRNKYEYSIDQELIKQGLELNNQNRAWMLDSFFNHVKNGFDDPIHLEFNKKIKNRNILQYKELYITFESDLIRHLNIDDYKIAVSKSWLPTKIDLFDRTWDLTSYGYLQF